MRNAERGMRNEWASVDSHSQFRITPVAASTTPWRPSLRTTPLSFHPRRSLPRTADGLSHAPIHHRSARLHRLLPLAFRRADFGGYGPRLAAVSHRVPRPPVREC